MTQQHIHARTTAFDIEKIRRDFPILQRMVHNKPLIYLDSGATTQKPIVVADTLSHYYKVINSNIHRGVHYLSQIATDAYESSREKIRQFMNASGTDEIIFVKGTTEAINLVASSYGRKFVGEGDEVLITAMEHHSNIVPWQLLCQEKGATLKVVPINDDGELIMEEFHRLLNERTKIVGIVHQSNTLGTINPIKEIIDAAHAIGVPVLVDGAQGIQHFRVDVQELDVDFYAFSGHKLYGPTGIGVLYGKRELLEKMPPYQGGGDMIRSVTFEKTTFNDLPYKFEAGTPPIAAGIGLGAAIDYLQAIGIEEVEAHEQDVNRYMIETLSDIPGIRPIGTAKQKGSVYSFVLENIHPHDIGTILDTEGIAIRTGHLCTQPLMQRFKIPAVARAALGLYNTKSDIDALKAGIYKVFEVFA